jgi:hypothetical protein
MGELFRAGEVIDCDVVALSAISNSESVFCGGRADVVVEELPQRERMR